MLKGGNEMPYREAIHPYAQARRADTANTLTEMIRILSVGGWTWEDAPFGGHIVVTDGGGTCATL